MGGLNPPNPPSGYATACSSRIAPPLTTLATLSTVSSYNSWRLTAPDLWKPNSQTWTRSTTVSGVSCRNKFKRLSCKLVSAWDNCSAWHSWPQAAPHWDMSGIPQTVTDEVIDEWGLRLRACVKAKGRHFEHSLEQTGSFQSHSHFIEQNSYAFVWLKYFKYSVNT